jgi:peroxiredoxin
MQVLRKGLAFVWRDKLGVVLLVFVAFLVLQRLGYLLRAPAISSEETQVREAFPIDFALPDLQDQTIRLSDLRGQVVLLNFWATWCPPCRAEMPSMQSLYQDYRGKGFEILAISSDTRGEEVVAPFVDRLGLTFPVLLDPRDSVGTRIGVRGIPTSYLLDKQGRVVGLDIGARDWNKAKVRRLLDRLLAEDGA